MSDGGLTKVVAVGLSAAGLLIAGAVMLTAPTPAWAEEALDASSPPAELRAKALEFVAGEVGSASEAEQAEMTDCILAAFEDLSDEEMTVVLAQDDFEDTLDALVGMRPDAEDAVEACLG